VYHISGDEKSPFSRTQGVWYNKPTNEKSWGRLPIPSRYSHSSNTAFTHALSLIFDISLYAPTEHARRGVLPKDYLLFMKNAPFI